jgi:hypothetical protein
MKAQTPRYANSDLMVKTAKVAFVMVFKISRGIHIMARYDKILIKSEISETILNIFIIMSTSKLNVLILVIMSSFQLHCV